MASDNDDSTLTVTPRPHAIANANTKPDSPPLLKRSKTISLDTSHTPHIPAARRASSSFRQPTDLRLSFDNDSGPGPNNAEFFNRDYIFPSCLGPYASNSRLTLKPANRRLSLVSDSTRLNPALVGNSPAIPPPPKVQESKKQPKLIARPDSASHSNITTSSEPTHSLMHYLVSLSIFS